MKLIVAGSRTFEGPIAYAQVRLEIDNIRKQLEITEIVSGGAKGADSLGEQYALIHKLKLHRKTANWTRHGRSAGYIRNAEMAAYADVLLAFWDGKSKGTKHMIDLMNKAGKQVIIVITKAGMV